MACPGEQTLERYLDGELEAAPAATLAAHLERCSACTRRLGRLRRLEALARSALTPVPPSPARWEAMEQALRRTIAASPAGAPARRPRLDRMAGALAIAAALLLFAFGWLLVRAGGSSAPLRLAFRSHAGANAAEVVELRCDPASGYTAGVVYPRDDSEPVVILLSRL